MLPIAEILFADLEAHAPKIYGYDAKWTPESPAYIGTLRRFGLEHDEPELAKILQQFALACWTLFRLAAMPASIFVSIRPARPSSST